MGNSLTLSIGALSFTLSAATCPVAATDAFYLRPTGQGDLLTRTGYDKRIRDEDRIQTQYGPLMSTHYIGRVAIPWWFYFNLQAIPAADARLIKAIVQESQETKTPVRLIDNLRIHVEKGTTGTRRRAKIGTVSTYSEVPGYIYYYAQYDIDPWIVEGSEDSIGGLTWLKIEAKEHNPDIPVPPTGNDL